MYRPLWILALGIALLGTTLTTYTQPTSIQTAQASVTSATTVTVTLTQTPAPGDVLLLSVAQNAGSGATISPPAGFTAINSQVNAGTALGVAQAYRVVQSGDGVSYAPTTNTSVGNLSAGIVEYAYVNSSPIMSQACTQSATPGSTVTTPAQSLTAPTIASSFFASIGGSWVYPVSSSVQNYEATNGTMLVHDQHSTPIYNFQQQFAATDGYGTTPSASVACTVLLAPTITPFTVSVVTPVATTAPTAAPTPSPTPSPTPTSSSTPSPAPTAATTHVMTAEYLTSSTEQTTAPSTYAPYLTMAYALDGREKLTQQAGIKVVHYTTPTQVCTTGPTAYGICSGAKVEYNLMKPGATYANTRATSCTGTMSFGYSGKYWIANVLGSYNNGSGTVVNASGFFQAVFNGYISQLDSSNGAGYVPDYWFIDNGDDYGVSPLPCGDTSQTVWAQGIANTIAGVSTVPGIFINGLGVWTMPWAQAQQNMMTPANVSGGEYEACYGGHGWGSAIPGDYVDGTDKKWFEEEYGEIQTILKHKIFWCYNQNTGSGSSLLANRLYMYASWLLSYDPNYAVFQTAMATTPSTFKVFPETQFEPTGPTVTASDVSGYKQTTGVYMRQFAHCKYKGVDKGPCAVVVNPDPSNTHPIPSNSFTQTAVLSGGGVLDGGTMTFNGPIVTSLGPTSAAILIGSVPLAAGYTFHGCAVYSVNDWFTTNLLTGGSTYAGNAIDPNSAAIIANFNSAFPGNGLNINGSGATVANNTSVNLATNSTTLYTIGGLSSGFANDPYNDDPSPYKIPWSSGFVEPANCGSGDCHNDVLNTQTCLDYESYNYGALSWNGSAYSAEAAFVHNLNHPFNDQYAQDAGLVTKAGLPYLGTMDFGEDASLTAIPHILFLAIPGTDGSSVAAGGYVAPASGGPSCVSSCTNKLPFGARLKLKASYPCPGSTANPQAHKLCVQMQTYGVIVADHNGTSSSFGTPLGPASGGSNPWINSDVSVLNGIPITDFDVMTLGTIH